MNPMTVNGWKLFWLMYQDSHNPFSAIATVLKHKRIAAYVNRHNEQLEREHRERQNGNN